MQSCEGLDLGGEECRDRPGSPRKGKTGNSHLASVSATEHLTSHISHAHMPYHCRSSISLQDGEVLRTGVAQFPFGDQLWAGGEADGATQKKHGWWWVAGGGWWMVDSPRLLLALIKINRYTKRKRPAESGMQPAATGGRKSTSDTTVAATVGGQNFRSKE
jgi:hypothetical protein